MSNISNKLKVLFNEYLNRLEEEKRNRTVRTYDYRSNYAPSTVHHYNNDEDFNGVIYFYEWSDIARTPKSYYTLKAFENFLNSSQIYLAGYEKEIIRHVHTCYIACNKGNRGLIIKSSYDSLKNALEPSVNKGSEDKEPYNVSITHVPTEKSVIQRPPMYEPSGRWDSREEMQDALGGIWGW